LKKGLVFLKPEYYRKQDFGRYEKDYFAKNIELFFWDVNDIVYKKRKNLNKVKGTKSIKNFFELIYLLKNKSKQYKKLYIFNLVTPFSIKSVLINIIIYFFKKNICIIEISNSGWPNYVLSKNHSKIYKSYKLFLINNLRVMEILKKFENRISLIICSIIKFNPKFKLVAGKIKYFNEQKNLKTKIINISSWDISNSMLKKIKIKNKNKIVYIDGNSPLFHSDRVHLKQKKFITNEWYKNLNKFLTFLEKKLECETVIMPPTNGMITKEYKKFINYRRISKTNKYEEIGSSRIVLARQSTAVTIAMLYKKPVLLLSSNEIIEDFYDYNVIMNASRHWKKEVFNIDNDYKKLNLKKVFKVKKHKYLENYCSYSKFVNNLPNSKIISRIINYE